MEHVEVEQVRMQSDRSNSREDLAVFPLHRLGTHILSKKRIEVVRSRYRLSLYG